MKKKLKIKALNRQLNLALKNNKEKSNIIFEMWTELLTLKTAPFMKEDSAEIDRTEKDEVDFFKLGSQCGKTNLHLDFMMKKVYPNFDLKKDVEDAPTNFSSRFMPNVKFKFDAGCLELISSLPNTLMFRSQKPYYGYCTSMDGTQLFDGYEDETLYNDALYKEVNYLQAMPELVLDGFYFDKKHGTLLSLNETFIKKEESEALEVLLSKASHFKKDEAFKVTEVGSLCDVCQIKESCTVYNVMKKSHSICECVEFQEKLTAPTTEDVKLAKALTELQLLLWGTKLPVLVGAKFERVEDPSKAHLANYTVSFTTADNTKKS